MIIAPNHKSFWDAFFVAAATKRPIRFMGKTELFEGRAGSCLSGSGPSRSGAAPPTRRRSRRPGGSCSTAACWRSSPRARGSVTRILGKPHKGAARLALETGATVVPCAITGTEKLFAGPLPRPGRVRVSFGEPIA